MLYRDYEEPLLPLITPVIGADNPLLPMEPYALVEALNHELAEVSYQVAAWQGSSLTGPENDLLDRINRCLRRLGPLQLSYRWVFHNTDILVKAETAVSLARGISQAPSDRQIRSSIKGFWVIQEGRNRHTLKELWVIRRQLRAINKEVAAIFTEVDQGLRPYTDDPLRTWTRDAIDAIDFSREHVLPLVEWIANLVDRAITKLSSLDSRLALQAQFWRNMVLAQGVTRNITCHHEAYGQRLHLGLVLSCEEVTTHWLLDNRTVEELGNIGNRGAEMGQVIKINTDPDSVYQKIRPPRPRERDN